MIRPPPTSQAQAVWGGGAVGRLSALYVLPLHRLVVRVRVNILLHQEHLVGRAVQGQQAVTCIGMSMVGWGGGRLGVSVMLCLLVLARALCTCCVLATFIRVSGRQVLRHQGRVLANR